MRLTPSQETALDLRRHTAIVANAGSGKTAVLVERYLKILEEHPEAHPRNIAAITFTDSSARDLKKKISEALRQRLEQSDNAGQSERWLEIRRQLGSGTISTIHSFCIQLLRTYPVEAHVDASFTILTSPEDQLLREECVRSAFYAILKEAYANDNSPEAKLLPVFRLFGRRKISSFIHSFLGSRFRVNGLINSLDLSGDEEILKLWNEQVHAIINDEILGKADPQFFAHLLNEKTTKGQFRQNAEAALAEYLAARTNSEKLRSYSALIHAFYTKEYTLNGRLFPAEIKKAYQAEAELLVAPYSRYSDLIDACAESYANPSNVLQYLDYSRQLLEIFQYVLKRYTEQKIQYSLLDYDDVIEYALRLVQNPEVQQELTKRFTHLMIDEYQDTDAAQYAIAKALTGSFRADNRLTVVGDPKQSIYSFRNADLELYRETIREITASHPANTPVILSESFRILPHPLAFINKISEYLFDDTPSNREMYEFKPLIEGRQDAKAGSVEFILPEKKDQFQRPAEYEEDILPDEISEDEVTLIAVKIRQIIADSTGKYWITAKNESGNCSPDYNDIAILLRSRTHQSELESELRKHNIPFVTYGGKGFYSRPEIIDITNYLRFLVNSNDDIALAGLLRSPYFGFSDIDLFRLAPEYNSVSNLWQRLALSDINTGATYIHRAFRQLNENLQIVGRVSTQFLLQKIISESGILGILQALPDGHQKIANLEKFSRFALAFGKEGYSGTFDFIERITLLMERDEMEAQAEPQTDLNAVHLMTIHNAKGLEFPIVFLPYLHSSLTGKDRRTSWNVLDKDLGIGIELPEQEKKQPIVELIKIRSNEKEIEEEKRIFYVAMTRARDHLIFSASSPKKSFKNSRMGWVLNSLGLEEIPADISSLPFSTTIERYETTGNYQESIQFDIPIFRTNEDIPLVEEVPIEKTETLSTFEFQLKDIEPSESIGRYSPSQLLTYLECPTKYYLRYQLGLPEEEKLPYYNEADTLAENVQGSLLGQIVHKALEKAGTFISSEFIDIELLEDTFQLVCNDLHLSNQERAGFFKRVKADIENVFSTAMGKKSLQAEQYHTELALRSTLQGGQMLSGIIDKLFLDADGIWNIIDYKTDVKESTQKKNRYHFQLQFYAYLVSLLYDQETVKAHVIYTHSGNTLSFIFGKKDFHGIGSQLQDLVSQIRSQRKAKSLKEIERRLSHCPECPYFDRIINLCVAGVGKEPLQLQTELTFSF